MADYWNCPKCGDKNKSSSKTCLGCGYSTYRTLKSEEKPKSAFNYDYSKSAFNYDYSKKKNDTVNKATKEVSQKAIYSLEGVRGRYMEVYDNRVVISTKATLGSLITGNISDGEKTIYYVDCIGVQFKKSDFQIGYIQLETASALMNNKSSNFFNENSFTFDTSVQTNEKMEEVANYIKKRVDEIKSSKNAPAVVSQVSAADEIKKFKELLDMGVITQEEFDAKKKQLLGL